MSDDDRSAAALSPAPTIRQPRGIYLLFTVEMWERFSFYGMRAILVLFIADSARGGMGWSHATASRLFGLYGFFAYALPVVGGYIADRFWGTHRSMTVGAVVIAAGHFSHGRADHADVLPRAWRWWRSGPASSRSTPRRWSASSTRPGDPRRDAGFTIFYMGVNVGALLGQIACGYLGESPRWGWHYGFGAAGVGMLCGLAFYLKLKPRYLAGIGDAPPRATAAARAASEPLTRDERDRMAALLVIMLFTIPFWMAFEQAASSMNFFAEQRTDRMVHGFLVPASWFQSVNPGVLIVASPLFAALWTALGRRRREPSTPTKMAAALVLLGAGFLFMVAGARRGDGGALVSPWWLVAAYTFHTFGELCLSPIGLSLVTKLTPAKFAAVTMGLWFSVDWRSPSSWPGRSRRSPTRSARGELFHLFGGQADFYFIFVALSAVAALALVACGPWLRRRMHGLDS